MSFLFSAECMDAVLSKPQPSCPTCRKDLTELKSADALVSNFALIQLMGDNKSCIASSSTTIVPEKCAICDQVGTFKCLDCRQGKWLCGQHAAEHKFHTNESHVPIATDDLPKATAIRALERCKLHNKTLKM